MILLHGNGENHKIFDVLIKRLAATHTCYALDSRCHGRSGIAPLTYDNMADDVNAFIDELKIDKPLIIGFSDGGIVALLLGIKYGDKISKIIAIGPNATPDGLKKPFICLMKVLFRLSRNDKIKLMLTEPNISDDELRRIKNPTVILAGEKDIVKKEHILHVADMIENSAVEILHGESHSGYVVHSPKLYGILEKYL